MIEQDFTIDGKEVTFYTTAENTNYRLTKTGTDIFKPTDQSLESEVSVLLIPLTRRYFKI